MLPRWSHKKVLRRNQAAGIIPPAQGIPGRCDAIHGAISTILLKPLPRLNSPRAVLPISHQPLCQSPIPTWLPCNPSRHCDCARCHPGPVPVDKIANCEAGTRRGEGVFSPQTWRWNQDAVKSYQQRTACRIFLSVVDGTTNCLSYFSVRSVFPSRVLPRTHTNRKWLATHPLPAVRPPLIRGKNWSNTRATSHKKGAQTRGRHTQTLFYVVAQNSTPRGCWSYAVPV